MLLKALLAFFALPGIVSGLIPLLIINLDRWRLAGHKAGLALLIIGIMILLRCVYDFYATGKGTLAHWTPPKEFVTVGLYRFVRNPMYLGVLMIIGGLSLYAGSLLLLAYLIVIAIIFHWHVVAREEAWLKKQFGRRWTEYAIKVSRWLPRSPSG